MSWERPKRYREPMLSRLGAPEHLTIRRILRELYREADASVVVFSLAARVVEFAGEDSAIPEGSCLATKSPSVPGPVVVRTSGWEQYDAMRVRVRTLPGRTSFALTVVDPTPLNVEVLVPMMDTAVERVEEVVVPACV